MSLNRGFSMSILIITFVVAALTDQTKLLPKSLRKKLCKREPSLKICAAFKTRNLRAQPTTSGDAKLWPNYEQKIIYKTNDGFSIWDICIQRPDLDLCKNRPRTEVRQKGYGGDHTSR